MVLTANGAYRAIAGNKGVPGWISKIEQIEVSVTDSSTLIVTTKEQPTGKVWQVTDEDNRNMYTFVRSTSTASNLLLYKCTGYCEGTEITKIVFMPSINKEK